MCLRDSLLNLRIEEVCRVVVDTHEGILDAFELLGRVGLSNFFECLRTSHDAFGHLDLFVRQVILDAFYVELAKNTVFPCVEIGRERLEDFHSLLHLSHDGLRNVIVDFTSRYAFCDLFVEKIALTCSAAFAALEFGHEVAEEA